MSWLDALRVDPAHAPCRACEVCGESTFGMYGTSDGVAFAMCAGCSDYSLRESTREAPEPLWLRALRWLAT